MIVFILSFVAATALLLAACRPAPPAPVRQEWLTMGTVAAVQCADAAAAPHVRDLAQRTFQSLDNDLSAWNQWDRRLDERRQVHRLGPPWPKFQQHCAG